ncbi:MAG: Cof-type HAD-IIB family hydrolase [Arachnia sp.]
MIKLLASDIDRTLLRSDRSLTDRTKAALQAAVTAGVQFVPASGRQTFSIARVLGPMAWLRYAIGSNGAVAQDLTTGTYLFEETLAVPVQTELVVRMRDLFPSLRAVSVRDGGEAFYPESGYAGMMDPGDHERDPRRLAEFSLAEVLETPSVKLVLRTPEVPVDELWRAAARLNVAGCSITTSGAPFLEVGPAGVSKAAGLARLCSLLGIAAADIVAFGDNHNDIDMLGWAGTGVAVANAIPEAKAVADELTASNDDDGVAGWIEDYLSR